MIVVDSGLLPDDVNHRQLAVELSGVTGFIRLDVGDGGVLILLEDDTDQVDIDEALAIAGAHVPGSLDIKLYRYLHDSEHDRLVPPKCIDYITGLDGRLHPTHSIVVDGEIRRIDYYASAAMDPQTGVVTYDDLVIREDFVYQRDAIGFARGRTQTITWFREDGTAHPQTKVRTKLYEPDDSFREGQRRRGNITDKLAMDLAGWLVATQTQLANPQDRLDLGRAFMRHHKISFDMFVEASSAQILYDVRDDVEPEHEFWIDDELAPGVTIRATILDALNIWNLPL